MKNLKLFSVIALVAMMSACGPPVDPTTVKFTSPNQVEVEVNRSLNFEVAVQVKYGVGETTFEFIGLPEWVSKTETTNRVTLTGTAPAEEEISSVTIKATNNNATTTQNFTIKVVTSSVVVGNGSKEKPYNVAQAIAFTDANPQENDVWVGGYIVGGVIDDGNVISNLVDNPEGYIFNNTGVRSTAVMIADNPNETDPTKVLLVRLNNAEGDAAATVRPALNLVDNCNNYKTYVKVEGDIFRYFGVPGIQRLTAFEGGSLGCGGVGPGDDILTVAQAIDTQDNQLHWVQGYVVGGVIDDGNTTSSINAGNAATALIWSAVGVRSTVIILADSSSERDYTKCVLVNLPTGDIRAAINLVDNPSNIGKEVKVLGKTRTYFGLPGVRDLEGYEFP